MLGGGQLENAPDGAIILAGNPISPAIGQRGGVELPAERTAVKGKRNFRFPGIEFMPP